MALYFEDVQVGHRACGYEEAGVEREVGHKFGRWLDVVLMHKLLLVARRRPRLATAACVIALTAVIAVPLLVALGVLFSPRWFPYIDLAQTEMRVRDVWSAHPPLVGLPGRIRGAGVGGSHPGPLSFYAMWPVYRLVGADGWALQAASVTLHLVAVALAIWIGVRRGGPRLALAVAATLALLLRAYGTALLAQPWNPNIPVSWWVVFLLAVWSVLCDDMAMLPIAVLSGSLCAQTHVSYVGLVAGIGVVTGVLLAVRLWRTHGHSPRRPARLRWIGVSIAMLALLWLPPLVQQLTSPHGNLRVLVDNFRHPYDKQVSFDSASRSWLGHLNVAELAGADRRPIGHLVFGFQAASTRPGVVLLAVWALAVSLAWLRRDPRAAPSSYGRRPHARPGAGDDEPHLRAALVLPHALGMGNGRARARGHGMDLPVIVHRATQRETSRRPCPRGQP